MPSTRAVASVGHVFAVYGLIVGQWSARIPDLQATLAVTNQQWGLILAAAGAGSVCGSVLTHKLLPRYPARTVTITALPLGAVIPILTSLAPGPALFATSFFVQAALLAAVNICANATGATAEQTTARVLLPGFHACFSAGTLLGAGATAAALQIGLSAPQQLAAAGVLLLASTSWFDRHLPHSSTSTSRRAQPVWTRQIVLLSALAATAVFVDSTAILWSGIYARDVLQAPAEVAALLPAVVVTGTITARLLSGLVQSRTGLAPVIILANAAGSGLVALCLLTRWPGTGYAAFFAIGFVIAPVLPWCYSMAGKQQDVTGDRAVATVAIASLPVALLGQPLLGTVIEALGVATTMAFFFPVALVLIAILVRSVRPRTLTDAG